MIEDYTISELKTWSDFQVFQEFFPGVSKALADFPIEGNIQVDREYSFNWTGDEKPPQELAIDVTFPSFPGVEITIFLEDDDEFMSVVTFGKWVYTGDTKTTAEESFSEALQNLLQISLSIPKG
jgi:hypothetical protein